MSTAPSIPVASEPQPPAWLPLLANVSPALLLAVAAPVALGAGLLAPDLGPIMLVGVLGIAGGVVSVLRPGIGLFLFTLMMYTRASEVLTTSVGLPSIAPLFTIWLLTGIVMHFGIGGLFHARPTGWQALVVYGLVLLASTLVAANPWVATYRVIDYVRELVYIALIVACVRQLSDLRIVVRALVIAGVIPACLTIYQILSGSTNSFLGFGLYSQAIVVPGEIAEVARPSGMVGDPNFYAMALIALIPLAFHRARWEKNLVTRQLSLLAGIIIAIASIMTYSRGGYLTLAVVIVALTIAGFIKFRSVMIVCLLFALLLPILPSSYSGRASSLLAIPVGLVSQEPPERGTATDTSVSGRMTELMAGVNMFLDHPLLGVGTNNYQEYYQEYSRPLGVDRRTNRAAHNLYVEIAAETGIVGIVAFGALVVTLFVSLRRVWMTTNRGNELHDLALTVAISLLALLFASIFLHFAYPRFFMVFAGLTLAIASVQNWRVASASRLRFSRLRPNQMLLTPVQHRRVVVWGGAVGIVAVTVASVLFLAVLAGPGGQPLFQGETSAAIRPQPEQPVMATAPPGPAPVGGSGTGATATAERTVPTATPDASTPAPGPTPTVDIDIQAALLALAIEPVGQQSGCIFVAEASHNICGDFATFFSTNGSAEVFGSPLSEQYIIDGTLVQYFERARFEWYAEDAGGGGYVLLTRLGAQQRYAATGQEVDPPALPADEAGCIYEDATGHNVCGQFAYRWVSTGGARIFGYPITEQLDVDGTRIQYFERARFELRPGASGTFDLVVAPLGVEDVERILSEATNADGTGSGG